jgi:hypothetical protein
MGIKNSKGNVLIATHLQQSLIIEKIAQESFKACETL